MKVCFLVLLENSGTVENSALKAYLLKRIERETLKFCIYFHKLLGIQTYTIICVIGDSDSFSRFLANCGVGFIGNNRCVLTKRADHLSFENF